MTLLIILLLIGFIAGIFRQYFFVIGGGIVLLIVQHPKGSGWIYLATVLIALIIRANLDTEQQRRSDNSL